MRPIIDSVVSIAIIFSVPIPILLVAPNAEDATIAAAKTHEIPDGRAI